MITPAKNQHYVPRVYIKSWETTVFSLREPHKPFQGVYEYIDHSFDTGNGITKEKVLCGNHTYTIDKEYFFVVPNCRQVRDLKTVIQNRDVFSLVEMLLGAVRNAASALAASAS